MMKVLLQMFFTGAVLSAACCANGQTLRIKCNSAEYLHLVLIGADAAGNKTVRSFSEVTLGFRKSISIYKEKYGYENYSRNGMEHDALDSTNRWAEMRIYSEGSSEYATLDLTKPANHVTIEKSNLELNVKQHDERGYLITDVTINDIQH